MFLGAFGEVALFAEAGDGGSGVAVFIGGWEGE